MQLSFIERKESNIQNVHLTFDPLDHLKTAMFKMQG